MQKAVIKRAPGASQIQSVPTNRGSSGMFRLFNDDTPGLQVHPLLVIYSAGAFMALVLFLHIFVKYVLGYGA